MRALAAGFTFALLLACSHSSNGGASDAGDGGPVCAADAGPTCARPYQLHVPASYAAGTATPLLLMFHGYGVNWEVEELYVHFSAFADAKGFLYATTDGTLDSKGNRFWNATDACCDFDGIAVDDVAYAAAIIDDVASKYSVDAKRVFVFGHSNGGFLAHRLACDLSPRIAGIVSLAGAVWKDASKCRPTASMAVLQLHGDADQVIAYDGGSTTGGAAFPSAHETVATWAAKNGCDGGLQATGETHDVDVNLPGNETRVDRYAGCPAGAVELWTIQDGGHIPVLAAGWDEPIWAFLMAHPKP